MWLLRVFLCETIFSQQVHFHGFSPVWILIWLSRLHLCAFLLQWMHRYGFFPLWVLISLWRCLHLKKTFPTVGAFIWLLSRMSSNMNFKISLSVIILSHIWCINMASPQNGYSCEFQDYLSMKIYYHSCCTGMALSR